MVITNNQKQQLIVFSGDLLPIVKVLVKTNWAFSWRHCIYRLLRTNLPVVWRDV